VLDGRARALKWHLFVFIFYKKRFRMGYPETNRALAKGPLFWETEWGGLTEGRMSFIDSRLVFRDRRNASGQVERPHAPRAGCI
jgi:hypothetical protein